MLEYNSSQCDLNYSSYLYLIVFLLFLLTKATKKSILRHFLFRVIRVKKLF